MNVKNISKKVTAVGMALLMGVSLCSTGTLAAGNNFAEQENGIEALADTSYQFMLFVNSNPGVDSTEKVTKNSSSTSAKVEVVAYRNDTDVPRLRARVYDATKKEKATIFNAITGTGNFSLPYIISGIKGDKVRLDADASINATTGTGAMRGYWTP